MSGIPSETLNQNSFTRVDHLLVFLILQLMHLLFPWTCMLIPLLSPIYLFTCSSRVKKLSHNPNKVTRKDKRGTRATLVQNEEGDWRQRDRGAAAREAAEKRAE